MAERKLDIFKTLDATNAKNADFYTSLSDEERKEFQPFLVTRWMSGTSNAFQVYLINEFINPYTFPLQRHKQLLWQLLTICNVGKKQRYVWNKLPGKGETGRTNSVKCVMEYFGYSTSHAVEALALLKRSQIIDMAEQLGWQQEDIAKIKRELKASDDDTPKKSKKVAETINNLLEF